MNTLADSKFILVKNTLVGETWVKKYLKHFVTDLNNNFIVGVSTNDIKSALIFTSHKEIEILHDPVWTKEYI